MSWLWAMAPVGVLAGPVLALAFLGLPAWWGRPWGETTTSRVVQAAFWLSVLANGVAAWALWGLGWASVRSPVAQWLAVGGHDLHGLLALDRLSWPISALAAWVLLAIAAFSRSYLHREPGFTRFHLLILLVGLGVQTVLLAGSLDLLIAGWELVGLASVWLIAFFVHRPTPVRHALWAFTTYRLCDVGLVAGAIWLHHQAPAGTELLTPTAHAWGGLPVPADGATATLVGFMLLWGAMGKSAAFPVGGWLPRAMEGPTPSSALCYGALSVHLGAYLLLRAGPILEASPWASGAVVLVGLATAWHGTVVGRAKNDVKGALAYAIMAQVGLIFVEIGLGWHTLALAHLLGHALLRTHQLLRAPNRLSDSQEVARLLGEHPQATGRHLAWALPVAWQGRLYRHALEGGHVEAWLGAWVLGPWAEGLRRLDAWEARWALALGGDCPAQPGGGPQPSGPREGLGPS